MTETPALPDDGQIAAIVRRIDRPVVLVGLMGSGKSTVGKRLAATMRRPFRDADAEIETAADRSIAEIFATHGEAYFRAGERRVIARIMAQDCGVLATGGGAFIDPETRALVLDRGIAVWLDADLDTLAERTGRRSHRPLLNAGDPREILARLKAQRDPVYALAPIRVCSQATPHHQTALSILKAIDAWL